MNCNFDDALEEQVLVIINEAENIAASKSLGRSCKPHQNSAFEELESATESGPPSKRKYKTRGTSTRHYCDVCAKEFERKDRYIRHLTSHLEARFECEVCKKRYKHSWHRDKHVKLKHPSQPFTDILQGEVTNREGTIGGMIFKCILCKKVFPYRSTYKTHMKSHKQEKGFSCAYPNCDAQFYTQFKLNEHLRGHNASFKCKKCNKFYASRSSQKYHEVRCKAETTTPSTTTSSSTAPPDEGCDIPEDEAPLRPDEHPGDTVS